MTSNALYVLGGRTVLNGPTNEELRGWLYVKIRPKASITNEVNYIEIIQILFSMYYNRPNSTIYIRSKWNGNSNSWSLWKEISGTEITDIS